jgi:hypothetical protein
MAEGVYFNLASAILILAVVFIETELIQMAPE